MKLLPLLALTLCSATVAQTLPPPSRTVYRCEVGGKVSYSDAPCLGAKKLEVEPTRGMNKSTGKALQGRDVRNEHVREGFAEMVRPITGMDARQLDKAGRRQRLSPEAQRQCRVLDQQLPAIEATERAAKSAPEVAAAQQRLLDLRVSYRKLRCE